jgi:hypothetical protein
MGDNSLIRLGDLTKPATVLIKKISEAVGGVFKPFQIVRVAQAEAEADKIRAEAQIQVTDLHRRAMRRFLEEEAKKQANIESITEKTLTLLEEKSSPQNIEDDWITNFFDKSRIVSDADMQRLWSSVLAGEANTPGRFSKQTVNLLADLDKSAAQLFTNLCGFGWVIGSVVPLVLDAATVDAFEPYHSHGMSFDALTHLEALGLIRLMTVGNFTRIRLPKTYTVCYFGTPVELTFPKDSQNVLSLGQVLLTNAGLQLASICEPKPIEGFIEFVCDRWEKEFLFPRRLSRTL